MALEAFQVYSSQPVVVAGKKAGGTFTINNGLTEFSLNEQGTIFRLRCNDLVYQQSGGLVSLEQTGSLTNYILSASRAALFAPGTTLTQVTATFRRYNGTGASFETITISRLDIESRNKGEDNGRQNWQVGFTCVSNDGSTTPVTYSF